MSRPDQPGVVDRTLVTDPVEAALRAYGLDCSGMSAENMRLLLCHIQARESRRASLRGKVLAELERPTAPAATSGAGLRWRLALIGPDGDRIDLGECVAPTHNAAIQRVRLMQEGKASLARHFLDVRPVGEASR